MRAVLVLMAVAMIAAEPLTWRTEYSTARKDATEAKKPICLVISSDNCIFCRKLESITMADAGVTGTLKGFVPVKIHAAREPDLVRTLKVNLYPTTVLAGYDGTIHAIINGYVSAEQMNEHLKKTLVAIADDEKADRELVAGKAAFEAGDLAKAAGFIRPLVAGADPKPGAKELLEKIERAQQNKAIVQAVRPQALLDVAKTLHDHTRYAEALDVCTEVARSHPGTAEAKAATTLAESIRNDPAKLAVASRQADEKAAVLQLALADTLLRKGDSIAAKTALEQVIRLVPTGPMADAAQASLSKMGVIATPASLKR